MNNLEFKEFLQKNADPSDRHWNPTDDQLDEIRKLIAEELAAGRKITHSYLKSIISSVSRSSIAAFESVDNSDLNALLSVAIKKN